MFETFFCPGPAVCDTCGKGYVREETYSNPTQCEECYRKECDKWLNRCHVCHRGLLREEAHAARNAWFCIPCWKNEKEKKADLARDRRRISASVKRERVRISKLKKDEQYHRLARYLTPLLRIGVFESADYEEFRIVNSRCLCALCMVDYFGFTLKETGLFLGVGKQRADYLRHKARRLILNTYGRDEPRKFKFADLS